MKTTAEALADEAEKIGIEDAATKAARIELSALLSAASKTAMDGSMQGDFIRGWLLNHSAEIHLQSNIGDYVLIIKPE